MSASVAFDYTTQTKRRSTNPTTQLHALHSHTPRRAHHRPAAGQVGHDATVTSALVTSDDKQRMVITMSDSIRRYSRTVMVSLITTAALLLAGTTAAAARANPGVFPPGSTPYGMSYGAWSAAWWQQAMADGTAPFAAGTKENPAPVDCTALGTRQVAFLVGTAGGEAFRTCTITPGHALLIPVLNAECSTAQGDGTTEAQLQACATGLADAINTGSLHASVDGKPVTGLTAFRFDSGLFSFTSSGANAFGVPAGTSPSVADGYWIMLAPLPAGVHTVNFGGKVFCTDDSCLFSTDATYTITITNR